MINTHLLYKQCNVIFFSWKFGYNIEYFFCFLNKSQFLIIFFEWEEHNEFTWYSKSKIRVHLRWPLILACRNRTRCRIGSSDHSNSISLYPSCTTLYFSFSTMSASLLHDTSFFIPHSASWVQVNTFLNVCKLEWLNMVSKILKRILGISKRVLYFQVLKSRWIARRHYEVYQGSDCASLNKT